MSWALAILTLVVCSVVGMLVTIRATQRAGREQVRDLAQVAFWAQLAVFGLVLLAAFAQPMLRYGWLDHEAGMVTAALMSILPLVVSFVGLRNGLLLTLALVRRRRAMRAGEVIEARVIERVQRLFAHDIMSVVVEAQVPERTPAGELAYRQRDIDRTRCHRFVETCPTEHWTRLEPGTTVALRYDPEDLRSFAVQLR